MSIRSALRILNTFHRTEPPRSEDLSPGLGPEISLPPPPPPKNTDIQATDSYKNVMNRVQETTTHLVELAEQVKRMLGHAKKLIASCAESKNSVSQISSLSTDNKSFLEGLEDRLQNLQVPQTEISELSSEMKLLFESVKVETEKATGAFDSVFQISFDLDQAVSKTIELLLKEAKTVQELKKAVQTLGKNQE